MFKNLKRTLLFILLQRVSCYKIYSYQVAELEQYFFTLEQRRNLMYKILLDLVCMLVALRFFVFQGFKTDIYNSSGLESFAIGLKSSRLAFYRDFFTYINSFVLLYLKSGEYKS